jgi:hypothetical protein
MFVIPTDAQTSTVKINIIPDQRPPPPHTPNQELHMRPHLPRFYHKNTILYFSLSF